MSGDWFRAITLRLLSLVMMVASGGGPGSFWESSPSPATGEPRAPPQLQPDILALGSNTDPYQPIERRFKITRQVLEVLWQTRHPVMIVTKSDLVLRDLDLLVQ